MYFDEAFQRMIDDEGGFVNHKVVGDRGGQTYAGISRNNWPQWVGWEYIDRGEIPPEQVVRDFYKKEFWDKLRLDGVAKKEIASSIFNFAVNIGTTSAALLAQKILKVDLDGKIGPITIAALNKFDEELFVVKYALLKINFYKEIVQRSPSQGKFLIGWLNRSLKGFV